MMQAREIERLTELAETDPLTGIANRRSFQKEIARRHAEQVRDGRTFCLMMIDVDGFKNINDMRGHLEGDRVLQTIASELSKNIRATDIVFRVGGDEFSVILPGVGLRQANNAALRLVSQSLGLSIGIVESTVSRPVEDLIQAADQAMYKAKKQGGNQVETGISE